MHINYYCADDINCIDLSPIPECPDCQNTYINASYMDVSQYITIAGCSLIMAQDCLVMIIVGLHPEQVHCHTR